MEPDGAPSHTTDSLLDNNNNSILGLLSLATCGLNGPDLGSDEEDIVFISIVLINHKKVLLRVSFPVRPTSSSESRPLSDQVKTEFQLTDEMTQSASGLQQVLDQIDTLLRSTLEESLEDLILVTDGQLPLRQCLHPQANTKGITLPKYYNSFIDLRKECGNLFGISDSLPNVTKHLNLEIEDSDSPVGVEQMTALVQHMIQLGHVFEEREYIQLVLQPGLCSRSDEIDGESVVRARGLPWQSSDADIATFFRGLNIAKGGVALCLSPQGRRNGEALVRFENQAFRDMALKRHKHHIGNRYIEVYRAGGDDFIAVAGGSNNEAQAFLTKGGQVIIRMRGLPYDCTNKQVVDFFRGGSSSSAASTSGGEGDESSDTSETPSARPLEVLDGEGGVLFVRRPDGRATGDAFVLFAEEADAAPALAKHRQSIGSRYIELFRSTTAEVQQVLNRCLESLKLDSPVPQLNSPQQQQLQASPPQQQQPPIPQHMITAGTRKDCVRLRGLPYEAQVEHILEFLGDHAKNIVFQGVHMVYNAQGQPSGEAFIQMDSEASAFTTASSKHHRYMMYFKKQRYIEVFQCSGEDMNCVLTGALSPKPPTAAPGILSYGHVYPTLIPAPVPAQHPRPYYLTYWPSFNTPPIPSNLSSNYNYHLNTTHMSLDCVGNGAAGLGKPLLAMTDNVQHPHLLTHHPTPRYVTAQCTPNYDFERGLDKHHPGHHTHHHRGPPGTTNKNYMELGLFIA